MNPARSDVYPPNVEAIGDMHGCTTEGHVFGCPCGVGGDAILARCYLCHRIDDDSGVLVTLDGAVRSICEPCWTKQDVEIPLDMTEDEDEFDNREGQPEFNGAFR
jgi:hypothetical protein